MPGTLFVCATPIGNMQDITLRVLETLKEVDLIAAEDTRTTQKILNNFNIQTPCTSYHRHNELSKSDSLIAELIEGRNIALVSDAGTPGISDPGHFVIKAAIERGIDVVCLPGPAACIAALVISGLAADRFVFEGFLPRNKKLRRERLEILKNETRTLIWYESPHRLKDALEDLFLVLGDRKMALVRELTKKFEEVKRGSISQILEEVKDKEIKGELVLVVEGCKSPEPSTGSDAWKYLGVKDHVALLLEEGMTKKEAIKQVAEQRDLPRRDVYNFIEKNSAD